MNKKTKAGKMRPQGGDKRSVRLFPVTRYTYAMRKQSK